MTATEEARSVPAEEEVKKTTTDDGSSSDDEVPELEEGEVTEQQKKVAEAAGLSEQVLDFIIDFMLRKGVRKSALHLKVKPGGIWYLQTFYRFLIR